MWTRKTIMKAIVQNPRQAADALAALQLDDGGPPLNADGLTLAAKAWGSDVGKFWVERIEERDALPRFVAGLSSQGVKIDFGKVALDAANLEEVDLAATNFDPQKRAAFDDASRQFRCRITHGQQIAG